MFNFFKKRKLERLEKQKSMVKEMLRNSIEINYENIEKCAIGCSKIGGNPDLPQDFKWYYFDAKRFGSENDLRPLTFLAQINCEEAHPFDTDKLLPPVGFLYFFYEFDTMTWGDSADDKGSARVFYFPGSASELASFPFPDDLPEDNQLPEFKITFKSNPELPSFDELLERKDELSYKYRDEYERLLDESGVTVDYEKIEMDGLTKLLGYANVIQHSMLMCCEFCTNCEPDESVNNLYSLPEPKRSEIKKEAIKWQLLFQLDSSRHKDLDMMWGDNGRIYFYIKEDDLRNLNFDNCWLTLECY